MEITAAQNTNHTHIVGKMLFTGTSAKLPLASPRLSACLSTYMEQHSYG